MSTDSEIPQVDEKIVPKGTITVDNPWWMGDYLTGFRNFDVSCEVLEESHKVARRYSNFEALQKILISHYPEHIVPVIPEKSLTEKVTNDNSDETKKRMRGFERFLNTVKDHPVMKTSAVFNKFLKDDTFPTDTTSGEDANLEEDTSTVTKYLSSWWGAISTTVMGTNPNSEAKNPSDKDFRYQTDLKKLNSLLAFVTRLYANSASLRDLLNNEYENTRNIGSVMGSLKSSIAELEGIKNSEDVDFEESKTFEQEKNLPEDSFTGKSSADERLKQSTENMNSENSNDKEISSVIISMEAGIDTLKSAIEAIERRNKYKNSIEQLNDEIAQLNSAGDTTSREKEVKQKKVEKLSKDLTRIDEVLGEEIERSILSVERQAQGYVSKLVEGRKKHLGIQRDKWVDISSRFAVV